MKLLIFGSRDVDEKETRTIIYSMVKKYMPDFILTSAGTRGVCKIARKVAEELCIPLILFFADRKYAGGMYDKRSRQALECCDRVLFVHNGVSKGTSNEIKLAEQLGKNYDYYTVKMSDSDIDWFEE